MRATFWRRDNPIMYGVTTTVFLVVMYVAMGFKTKCSNDGCINNFTQFWNSAPNEVGDTLAGLFGALALIWVVVTVFLQSQELAEQRKELAEQRLATQDMAESMKLQAAEVLEDKLDKEQRQKDELYEERLKTLINTFDVASKRMTVVLPPGKHFSGIERGIESADEGELRFYPLLSRDKFTVDTHGVDLIISRLRALSQFIQRCDQLALGLGHANGKELLSSLEIQAAALIKSQAGLSTTAELRAQRLDLPEVARLLEEIRLLKIWGVPAP